MGSEKDTNAKQLTPEVQPDARRPLPPLPLSSLSTEPSSPPSPFHHLTPVCAASGTSLAFSNKLTAVENGRSQFVCFFFTQSHYIILWRWP